MIITQKLMKLKRKLLIMVIGTTILLLINLKKLTSENVAARLAQANLASKDDITDFLKNTDFDDKLKNCNTRHIEVKTRLDYLKKMLK